MPPFRNPRNGGIFYTPGGYFPEAGPPFGADFANRPDLC